MKSRRDLLRLAGAAAAATALPAIPSLGQTDGPDAELLEAEEWAVTLNEYVDKIDLDDEAMNEICRVIQGCEAYIAETPARTIAGVAVKLRRLSYLTGTEDGTNGNTLEPELLTSALATLRELERAQGGSRS